MFRNVIIFSLLLVFVGVSCVSLCYAELTIEPLPSGKVGIGATSPLNKLDVNGDIRVRGGEVNSNANIWFATSAAIEDQLGMGGLVVSKSDGPILFRSGTGNPIRMSIETDGNIGVGTTEPGAKLHVSSTANTNNTIGIFESGIDSGGEYNEFRFSALANTSPAAIRYILGTTPNSSELSFLQQPDSGSGLVERMRINKVGNVGIGTTNPNAKLHISATTNDTSLLNISSAVPTMTTVAQISDSMHGSGILLDIIGDSDGDAGGPFHSVFTKSGNVGIGTSSPGAKLDIYNGNSDTEYGAVRVRSMNASGTSGRSWEIRSGAASTGDATFTIADRGGNGEINNVNFVIMYQNGNVGIGTSSPGYKLHVNGTAAGTSWTNLSSREYKDNIKKVDSSKHSEMLAQLMDIDLATYNYKQEYSDDTTEKIGFIAEEMPKEVLSIDGKGVDVYELLTYTIGAMKAQQETVMTNKEEIKTLKAENEQLRNALTSLTDRQKTVESMLLALSLNLPKEKLVMK